jgi:hypothetical protein
MKKSQFYILVALIWIVLILGAIFNYDFYVDIENSDCQYIEQRIDGITPFRCTQDLLLRDLMTAIFYGIIGTAVLSKVITIDNDEEE